MFHSIRWRIAIPYALLILLVLAGLAAYLVSFIRETQLADLDNELTNEARVLSSVAGPLMADEAERDGLDDLAKQWADLLNARVTIITSDGTVVGESHEDRTVMDNHLERPEIRQAIAEGKGKSIRFSQSVDFDMMYVAVPITEAGEITGFARIALPLQQIEDNIKHLRQVILAATLLATIMAIALGLVIAGYTTHPLRKITEAVQHMSVDEFDGKPISVTRDEIGQLGRAFNLMGNQLRAQFTALETERSKLAAVLQEMTDGVLIADAEGQVQLMNPAAERLFRVQVTAAIGKSLAGVVRQHQIIEIWRQCLESGQSQVTTLEIPTRQLFLQAIAIPLGKALPGSTLLVFQDLTQVRRLETVRRDFISNISHELRTPLAALKALTETLQETALDDPPAARRFINQVENEVDALTLMVQELLELSRIESGKVPLQYQSIHPCRMLTTAIERLGLQAERSGLKPQLVCPDDLPLVLADPPRIEQVLVNLLSNAIKFTPAGGEITLSAYQQDDVVVFNIRDTGVGIPADDLPRIFERFYKADRARSGGGTGLGLAIARHLVEAHQGRIWAESVEGAGSTFYFSLPVAP